MRACLLCLARQVSAAVAAGLLPDSELGGRLEWSRGWTAALQAADRDPQCQQLAASLQGLQVPGCTALHRSGAPVSCEHTPANSNTCTAKSALLPQGGAGLLAAS